MAFAKVESKRKADREKEERRWEEYLIFSISEMIPAQWGAVPLPPPPDICFKLQTSNTNNKID
jgi:hypothetical protein